MKTSFFSALLALLFLPAVAHAAAPVVTNIRAAQRVGTHLVDIYYSVSDADGNSPLTVYVAVSDNAGASYSVPVFTLTGAVGPGVTPGNDRHILWNAGTDWPGRFSSACRVKIIADDGTAPPAPAGMVYIPAGPFRMGDSFLEGDTSELPVHTVYVSAFFMDKYEVSGELWQPVFAWAVANGYTFGSGSFKGNNHPVQFVTWDDAAAWCNARSEMEGLTPCYYTSAEQTTVYSRGNQGSLENHFVKWNANGYRLPTEAEWEKAARGGLQGKRFPWGDTVSHAQANYYSQAEFPYDISSTRMSHPLYATDPIPWTSPVGSFTANGYGLYDMAGNVGEWCWDWFGPYGQFDANSENPRGPLVNGDGRRIWRGGDHANSASTLRSAARNTRNAGSPRFHIGFRSVRSITP